MIKKIAIDLKALLDFRLGLLTLIDPGFALEVMTSPQYYIRRFDRFESPTHGVLSPSLAEQIIQQIPMEVMRASIVSKIPQFVVELLTQLNTSGSSEPLRGTYEVEVNTYPWVLEPEDRQAIAQALGHVIHNLVHVSVVRIDYAHLSTETIQAQYPCFILYEATPFFNHYAQEITDFKLQHVHVYAPRLNFIRNFLPEEDDLLTTGVDPFHAMEIGMGPWMDLTFLPVSLFCAATPENKDVYVTGTAPPPAAP